MTLKPLTDRRKATVQDSSQDSLPLAAESILSDYRIAYRSRQASLIGRREVLTGKAKFGIFGDGKEVAQLAMAQAFKPGDFRAGYYRDQTFHFATGISDIEAFFAQLFAHASLEAEPASAGRQMTGHFASRSLDAGGRWLRLTDQLNSSADLSPTASQMPRLVGLAYASRLYRQIPELAGETGFSRGGNEVAFGTIGNASCAEGLFWESINAIGVLAAPAVISIWDDGYGISVPNEHQITKADLSSVLSGFARASGDTGDSSGTGGYQLFTVAGWDYPRLLQVYAEAAAVARQHHIPAIIHVTELTQPQGHSTSGSHERYKSAERLAWEEEHDCLPRMRQWMVSEGLVSAGDLDRYEQEDRATVTELKNRAWQAYRQPIEKRLHSFVALASELAAVSRHGQEIESVHRVLSRMQNPGTRDILAAAGEALVLSLGERVEPRQRLAAWRKEQEEALRAGYGSDLHCDTARGALAVPVVEARYPRDGEQLRGFEILNAFFEQALKRDPRVIAIGEDVGKLGDVNQGFAGLQAKFGELRVSDTGIREATIIGQAIGMAMRGLRPIAEIQYLDYILYALQILSDDLATLRWRTRAGQMAPVILRTRGHRLEGVWHAGSPMAGLLGLVRGIYLCVPRDMRQAAGMYNTLLQGDDPAIVIEVLNGYRLKEPMAENLAEATVPLGVPEILRQGSDVTVVTYGACCRIAQAAAQQLATLGIETEVIDVQTLLPFDLSGCIVGSLKKTHRILFVDEDVPGGASAYMMQQVLEVQDGYYWLDHPAKTLTAQAHRPVYGSDGDYASKPNRESILRAVYELVREGDPAKFPPFGG